MRACVYRDSTRSSLTMTVLPPTNSRHIEGGFAFDAIVEFKLARDWWRWGAGGSLLSKAKARTWDRIGASSDVARVTGLVESGVAHYGAVVIVGERGHCFGSVESEYDGVDVLIVRTYELVAPDQASSFDE